MLYSSGRQPDILHMHEWHTAAVGMLYWDIYYKKVADPDSILPVSRCVFVRTVVDESFSGVAQSDLLRALVSVPESGLQQASAGDDNPQHGSLGRVPRGGIGSDGTQPGRLHGGGQGARRANARPQPGAHVPVEGGRRLRQRRHHRLPHVPQGES
eukprot:scaffold3315_cov353-Prasinococcus_capsulatus_cf.AAC.4